MFLKSLFEMLVVLIVSGVYRTSWNQWLDFGKRTLNVFPPYIKLMNGACIPVNVVCDRIRRV